MNEMFAYKHVSKTISVFRLFTPRGWSVKFNLVSRSVTSMERKGKQGGVNGHRWPKVILFGDSITQFSFSVDGCWGSLLANFLQRKCDVINRGFSGYNTRWCNLMINDVFSEFESTNIAMVTIFLGANDSNLPDNKHQHVPLEEYKGHLREMIEKLQSRGIARERIVLISPPACDEIAWEQNCIHNGRPFHKCNVSAGEFAKGCVQVAKETGTYYIDLYTEMMKNEDWKRMLNDGLHLSPRGSEFLFSLLRPLVTKVTGHLPMVFPEWKDIDNDNPRVALGS